MPLRFHTYTIRILFDKAGLNQMATLGLVWTCFRDDPRLVVHLVRHDEFSCSERADNDKSVGFRPAAPELRV